MRLVDQKGKGKQYDLPQVNEVVDLIVGNMTATSGHRDVVLELQSRNSQQIRDDHPLFMSLCIILCCSLMVNMDFIHKYHMQSPKPTKGNELL